MLIKDEVYKFEVWYIDKTKNKAKKTMYLDKAEIFALEDVPQTTFYIGLYYLNLKEHQVYWSVAGEYDIGDKITLEEAEKETKAIEEFCVDEDDIGARINKEAILDSLKAFCKGEKNNTRDIGADKIYLNKNIDLDCSAAIKARVRVVPPSSNNKIISPSQLVNGKIYPIGQIKRGDVEDDRAYIDLE